MIALLLVFLAGRSIELKPYPKVISQEWQVVLFDGRNTRGPNKIFYGEKEAMRFAKDREWANAKVYRTDRILIYER